MIYKFLTGIFLMILSFGALAHPGHGEHMDYFNSIYLQQIFDASGFILLILSIQMLRLSRNKNKDIKK